MTWHRPEFIAGVRSQESGGGSAVDGFPGIKQLPFRSKTVLLSRFQF
ncbi:hypothetical protein [Trichormus sp. NMC-1]|nr:hypothetical protein [Trichormus sp. NMC-1]